MPIHSTVLIVDDEAPCRELLARILEKRGIRTLTATHGFEALAILSTTTVDAILVDLEMPQMDGREFCTQLKRDPRLRNLPVLLISGHHELEGEAATLGARGFLTKPFRPSELLERVFQLL